MTGIEADCSPFIVEAIRSIGFSQGLALDIPSGEGRHSRLLATCGMHVISADLDIKVLARGASAADRICRRRIASVRLDATKPLPFKAGAFDLVLMVHFDLRGVLPLVERVVKSRGFFIVETYGSHGDNWRTLPFAGEVSGALSPGFDLIQYTEKPVRTHPERATVRMVARKRS